MPSTHTLTADEVADLLSSASATLPTLEHGTAPHDLLATRRQLRDMDLRPGGHPPVAQMRCRRCATRPTRTCTNMAWLYRVDLAKPKRTPTLAQEAALDKAMAARQTCPLCRRRFHIVLPLKTIGSCLECAEGAPAAPGSYLPAPSIPKAA